MSDVAVAWAKAQDCPTRPSKPVLAFLASWANAVGEGWVAVEILALELQVDARSVQRALAELRKARLLLDTGKWETWEGKRYPIFRLPLETGYANTSQKLRALREAARRRGDSSVTPSGGGNDSSVTPTGDGSVTQIGKGKGKGRSNDLPPERAREVDAAFGEAFAAYERCGQDRTHLPNARRMFQAVFLELGHDASVNAIRRYVAEDRDLKRGDFGAPAFETFLEGERWRRYVVGLSKPVQPRTRFAGPDALRAAIVAHHGQAGEGFAGSYLDRASWDPEARTLTAATGVGFDALRPLSQIFTEHGVALRRPGGKTA